MTNGDHGVSMKQRPKFVEAVDVLLPYLSPHSTQFFEVEVPGLRKNMVLLVKNHTFDIDAGVVGFECIEDEKLTLKRMNPTDDVVSPQEVNLTVMAL